MIRDPRAAALWWRDLQPDLNARDPARRSGDRAALARLRRCATVAEAMDDPVTIALFRRCGASHPDDLVEIALAAAVLAHVRADVSGTPVARQIGPESPDRPETAAVKPLRFQRLMQAQGADERLVAMRRLVALAERKLNLRDLAEALLRWTPERRRRWIYDYWSAAPVDTAPTDAAAP